jgi:dihydroorotate dehydrogenase electron transfer subunit
MAHSPQAPRYADHARQETVAVVENTRLARDTYRVRFDCPELARGIVPGQFLMLRWAEGNDPLLGRPLALYDTVTGSAGAAVGVDVVYLVKGKFTSRLAGAPPGQRLVVWGPLGNGFPPEPAGHLIMVAGGIGQTPFLALAQEYLGQKRYGQPPRPVPRAARVTLCYGARTAELLAGVEDFARIGVEVRVATDDGSCGRRGFVTEVLQEVLAETEGPHRIVTCGPEPMLQAVAGIARTRGTPCQVSLETPMACGIGICFTCVAKIKDADGRWDYHRTCVEGPVFDAERVEW